MTAKIEGIAIPQLLVVSSSTPNDPNKIMTSIRNRINDRITAMIPMIVFSFTITNI